MSYCNGKSVSWGWNHELEEGCWAFQGWGGSLLPVRPLVTPPGIPSRSRILGPRWIPESASVLRMVPAPPFQRWNGPPPPPSGSGQEAAPKLACQVSIVLGLGSQRFPGDAHMMEENNYSWFLFRNQEIHP